MKTKVTLRSKDIPRGSSLIGKISCSRPTGLPAFPRKNVNNVAIAIRNVLIYCEMEHFGYPAKDMAKRYSTTINTINSIYYKTKSRFKKWREEYD